MKSIEECPEMLEFYDFWLKNIKSDFQQTNI
jgi:hypothetical protein